MSVNNVQLLGRVGKDPEVRHLDGGNSVASFSLATTKRGYKKQDGTVVEDRTTWHNIVVWGGLVKVVEPYVKKGTQLFIEGEINNRSYDDKEGNKRYVSEVVVKSLVLLGGSTDKPQQNTPNVGNDGLPF